MVLDAEERWFEDHADEFVSAPGEMRAQLIEAAVNTQNKTERMNIRMSKSDMENLKAIASREGLPYQSLVTSILHKYTSGLLVDINEKKRFCEPVDRLNGQAHDEVSSLLRHGNLAVISPQGPALRMLQLLKSEGD